MDKYTAPAISFGLLLPFAFATTQAGIPLGPSKLDATAQARIVETYGKLPLSFEANQGQTDSQVKFLSRGPGYSLFLTPTEAVLSLRKTSSSDGDKSSRPVVPAGNAGTQLPRKANESHPCVLDSGNPCRNDEEKSTILRMQFVGANPNPKAAGLDELPGKVNYLRGNDLAKWRTNIATYAKVRYEQVYPGIDLVYYGNQQQLEYDFVVAPGTDPKTIRLGFAGADKLTIDGQGDLVLSTAGGNVRLHKPLIYQDIGGQRRNIDGRYVLHKPKGRDQARVGFQVAAYDKSQPLVIDPVLVYSTYLGGSTGTDWGLGIAVDGSGNAYVTGTTQSPDFPSVNASIPTFGEGGTPLSSS